MTLQEHLREGAAAARVGHRPEAEDHFRAALALDFSNVEAWLGLSGVVESVDEKRRCFEQVLAIDARNAEALAGLAWLGRGATSTAPAAPPADAAQPMRCANHPNTETMLRCNRCGKPICVKCAVHTPVGYRCKECVNQQQAVYFNAQATDYPLAGLLALSLSAIAGFFIPLLAGLLPFYSWLVMIVVGPAAAGLLAEVIRRAVRRRRGRRMGLVVAIAAGAGSIAGLLIQWLALGSMPLLAFGIYVFFLLSTLYARLR